MNYFYFSVLALFLLSCSHQSLQYPETRKDDTADHYFGTEVADPYRWLEDDRSEETMEWVKKQNELTFSYLEKIPFREKIRERLLNIMNFSRMGAPWKEGNYHFYSYNDGLQNQNVYYIKKSAEEEAKVFLDPNLMSDGGIVALTNFAVSKDHKYAGYGISRGGSDWREFFIREIETGNDLDDHLKWIKFSSIAWYKDGFFYNRFNKPEEGDALKGINLNSRVFYHKAGTPQTEDKLVYEDTGNPGRIFNPEVTEDERYLVLYISETTTGNALFVKDLGKPETDFNKLVTGFGENYSLIGNKGTKLFILTNLDAPMYKLIGVDMNNPSPENWEDIIGEKKSQVLKSCRLAGDKIIAHYMRDARSVLEVFSFEGSLLYEIPLPGIGTVSSFNSKYGDNTAFFMFTSFNVPPEVYQYNVKENSTSLYFKPQVDFARDDYITRQVFYKSKDGTVVPMFIVHHKDMKPDGNRPALLYGYGGFNVTYTPAFSVQNVLWLENGGVFALAGIRGGGEYGEDWHQAGTILKKQNVFDDFIAAAEFLIDENFTSPKRLAIIGGSNGGLLVGAVINQRPDLFAVAFPAVGVMDMLRYHKFTIGRLWITDYGSSEDSTQFDYLYRYSPLHNLRRNVDYPAVMVTTADHDDRVVPAHSFKYIAGLQELQSGKNPSLIRIETEAGHGAGKPISKTIEEIADITSFGFYQMKVTPKY